MGGGITEPVVNSCLNGRVNWVNMGHTGRKKQHFLEVNQDAVPSEIVNEIFNLFLGFLHFLQPN